MIPFGDLSTWFGPQTGTVAVADKAPSPDRKPALGPADGATATGAASTGVGSFGLCGLTGYGKRPAPTVRNYLSCLCDPVMAMARAYALEPIKAGKGRIAKRADAPAEWATFVENVTKPLLPGYLRDAVWAVDLGWSGFQNIYERPDGKYVISKVLSCQQSASGFNVDPDTYEPVGVVWNGIELFGHKGFGYTYDPSDEYRGRFYRCLGRSRLENCIESVWKWRAADDTTGKLGTKAGGIVVGVGFPPGDGETAAGAKVPRWKQADDFGKTITSGAGYYTFPLLGGATESEVQSLVQTPAGIAALAELFATSMWKVKLDDLGDPGTSIASFTEEKRYIDAHKCMGYFVPPEAILQGVGGNQAKAKSAANSGTAANEGVNRDVYRAFNEGPVNSLLVLNFGPEAKGAVWWEPEPLEDSQAVFDQTILQAAMSSANPDVQQIVADRDLGSVFDRMGVPKLSKADLRKRDKAKADALAQQQPPGQPGDPSALPQDGADPLALPA